MGYSDHITIIKNSLNRYQTEEKKLSELYKTAKENAQKETKQAIKKLNDDYYASRNTAYADSARSERNLNNQLAARGLGFSGEAAQAKLNANISLSGRLKDLARQRNDTEKQYTLDLADKISKLSMDEADKLRELLNSRTQYNLQIADMELKKESADADREASKQMQADKIQAEKDIEAQKLEFAINELDAKIALEKEKLQAEKDMLNAELRAEREAQIAQLEAEKEMAQAELNAKYYGSGSSSGSSSGSASGSGSANSNSESGAGGYIPNIKPQELAKQITGGKRLDGEDGEYAVNKFLLGLNTNYDVDPEYYDQLILMLETYGYNRITVPEMRTKVITYEARAYNSDDEFNKLYDSYVSNGYSPYDAKRKARTAIAENQMNFIYENVENNTEFKVCCTDLGISRTVYELYLNEKGR